MNDSFQDEYRKQLLDRFEKRSKSFTTLFRVAAIFTFAFLAFVLVPLIALQYEEPRIQQALADAESEFDENQGELEVLGKEAKDAEGELGKLKFELGFKRESVEDVRIRIREAQVSSRRLTVELESNAAKLIELTEGSAKLETILSDFKNLPGYDADKSTRRLRDALSKAVDIAERLEEGEAEVSHDDPCASDDLNTYMHCKAIGILEEQLLVYYEIVERAERELNEYIDREDAQAIRGRLDALKDVFTATMNDNPQFWRTFEGKRDFFDVFGGPMNEAFAEVATQLEFSRGLLESKRDENTNKGTDLLKAEEALNKELEEETDKLPALQANIDKLEPELSRLDEAALEREVTMELIAEEQEEFESILDELEAERDGVQASMTGIEDRLSKLQSPFGSIPVRLQEAVLAFPVMVAVAVFMYLFGLVELMRLRREYDQSTRQVRPDASDSEIRNVTPLWLDPIGVRSNNIWRGLFLSSPVFAYCVSLGLIGYGWSFEDASASTFIIRVVYVALYVLGFMGFVLCGTRIRSEWKRYGVR